MTFVRDLALDFIRDHLHQREKDPKWLFDRLGKEKPTGNDDSRQQEARESILNSLLKIARDLDIFIGNKYNDRFPELTEPLIPKLQNGSKQSYYDAFKAVADELFYHGISWSHIVTFLVYNAELTNKVIELPSHNDKDKTFKMVSQIIRCICRYFEENVLQWIEEQDGGWQSIIAYEKQAERHMRNKDDASNCRGMKQYLGVAAFAAIIGGLYLCSKLTVQ